MTRHNSGGMGIMNTLFTVLLLLSKSILGETVYELESTYIGGRVQDGVMFDVQTIETPPDGGTANTNTASGTTTPNGITIHGLNILTPLTTTFCVELYTKAGSFSAAAADESKWTYLGSFNIVGQGPNTPSTIPMGSFDPINVGMGETQAFYVTTLDEKLRYTALEDQPNDNRVTGEVYVTSESHVLDGSSSGGTTTGSGTTTSAGSSNTAPQTEISTPVNRNGGGGVESGDSSGTISKGTGKERTSVVIEHEHGSRSRHSHHSHSHHHHEHDRNLMKAQDVDTIEYATQDTNKRILQTINSGDGLSLQILVGVAKNYPFAESWPNRVFNGALMYTLGTDTTPDLTDAQAKEAFQTKRGDVKCDAPAMSLGSLSVAPTAERVPSSSPTKAPTPIPTVNPTKSPTASPTTLDSTIKKVATTLHGGLKQAGMMFDLKVPTVANGGPAEGVTIMAFETSTFLTDNICFEVYTKSGTYEGFENDVTQAADGTLSSDSWTVLGASTVTGQGEKAPTILPIGDLDPVYMAPGSTQAFYITMTVTEQRYTQPKFDEKSGSVFSSDPQNYLELLVGSAVAYPFGETWKDRIYNGAAVFALGDVPDGRYNSMTAANRERSCPEVTTNVPTKSPTKAPIIPDKEIPTSESGTTPSTPTTPTTSAPSFGMTSVPEETGPVGEISTETSSSRLADVCPELVVTPDDMVTENVVVPYSYTFYADSTADASLIATEMEDMLHRSLIESMCPAPTPSASRMLQEAIQYRGFRSGLTDTIDSQGCDTTVTVPEGQTCYLVSGGVTAVVPRDTDAELVAADVDNFSKKTFSNPTNYEQFGVTGVEYIPIAFDPTATDNPYATDQYPNVDGAQESDQDTDESGSNNDKKLSTTGIIIVSVLAGVLAIVILGFVAMRIHKKRNAKSADDSELFQEFPDEEERYGIAGSSNPYGIEASSSSGYNESIAPLSKWGSKSSPPPPPDETPPAMILNEADDISLFSSDKSRSRFAPSSMVVPPDSPGSRGSKGSNNSKKSVEFIKAGHSFGATSNVPEDTVDL